MVSKREQLQWTYGQCSKISTKRCEHIFLLKLGIQQQRIKNIFATISSYHFSRSWRRFKCASIFCTLPFKHSFTLITHLFSYVFYFAGFIYLIFYVLLRLSIVVDSLKGHELVDPAFVSVFLAQVRISKITCW